MESTLAFWPLLGWGFGTSRPIRLAGAAGKSAGPVVRQGQDNSIHAKNTRMPTRSDLPKKTIAGTDSTTWDGILLLNITRRFMEEELGERRGWYTNPVCLSCRVRGLWVGSRSTPNTPDMQA